MPAAESLDTGLLGVTSVRLAMEITVTSCPRSFKPIARRVRLFSAPPVSSSVTTNAMMCFKMAGVQLEGRCESCNGEGGLYRPAIIV